MYYSPITFRAYESGFTSDVYEGMQRVVTLLEGKGISVGECLEVLKKGVSLIEGVSLEEVRACFPNVKYRYGIAEEDLEDLTVSNLVMQYDYKSCLYMLPKFQWSWKSAEEGGRLGLRIYPLVFVGGTCVCGTVHTDSVFLSRKYGPKLADVGVRVGQESCWKYFTFSMETTVLLKKVLWGWQYLCEAEKEKMLKKYGGDFMSDDWIYKKQRGSHQGVYYSADRTLPEGYITGDDFVFLPEDDAVVSVTGYGAGSSVCGCTAVREVLEAELGIVLTDSMVVHMNRAATCKSARFNQQTGIIVLE